MLPKQVCLIGHHEGDYLKHSTKAEVGDGIQGRCKGCLSYGINSGVAHLASLQNWGGGSFLVD